MPIPHSFQDPGQELCSLPLWESFGHRDDHLSEKEKSREGCGPLFDRFEIR